MACKGSGVQIPSAPPQVRGPRRRRPPANRPHRAANRQQSALKGRSSVRYGGAAGQHRWRHRPAARAHPGRGRRPSTARSIDHRPASRPHLYQGSAPGPVFLQDRACNLRERPTAGDRYGPLGSDGMWTNVDQAWRDGWVACPVQSRTPPASGPPRPGTGRAEASRTAEVCHAPPLASASWPTRAWAERRWGGDGIEALAVNTRTPQAPARGTGLVLGTLAAGQFLMTLDSSVMNVSIATVARTSAPP